MATIENFQEEHQRLMRALHTSLERESELQRQLRRMKEQLVAVALRLQVAVKVAQYDERTTVELRRDCSEAKINAAIANKRADEAAEIIQALKIEISSLKRKLRELQTADDELPDVGGSSLHALAAVEVDKMSFNVQNRVKFAPNTGGHPEKATPFQQWKMQHFVWTPDTPAASALHDKHAVDMLADAVTTDTLKGLNRFQFPSQSSVGKLRRRLTSDEDKVIVPKAVQKQVDSISRLAALPNSRNPDRLCPTTPDSMNAGIASPLGRRKQQEEAQANALPQFITSMHSRRSNNGSPNKNRRNQQKGAGGAGGDSEFDDCEGGDERYMQTNADTKQLIESAYRWSMQQQQQGGGSSGVEDTGLGRPASGGRRAAKKVMV